MNPLAHVSYNLLQIISKSYLINIILPGYTGIPKCLHQVGISRVTDSVSVC